MQNLHIMYKEILSPLIKKSNSSICIVYLSFLYPETKHKSYLPWETNLRLAKPRTLSSSCNLPLPLNYHYEVLFYRTLSKKFYISPRIPKGITIKIRLLCSMLTFRPQAFIKTTNLHKITVTWFLSLYSQSMASKTSLRLLCQSQ